VQLDIAGRERRHQGVSGHRARCAEIWGHRDTHEERLVLPGIEAWVHTEAADGGSHGGDVLFVSRCGYGHVYRFALADVAGHGRAVADFAEELRGLMRTHVEDADQTELARHLNEGWLSAERSGRFATALFVTCVLPRRTVVVCNAGHPRPLWYRASQRSWCLLDERCGSDTAANLPLGIIEPTGYTQFAVEADADDLFVLYSDAYLETRIGGHPVGEQGLLDLAASLPVDRPDHFGSRLRDVLGAVADRIDDDRSLIVMRPGDGVRLPS
jgi:serine phosphatase RsbU (regulator of sigma subunit)